MPLPLIKTCAQGLPVARILLTHGAGASCESSFMQQLVTALAATGIEVWCFNFPYMQQQLLTGKKALPDKMPVLLSCFTEHIKQSPADLPLFIAGKSMGGRVASMVKQPEVKGIFAYGYPFHAPAKQQWRTAHFTELNCPLFIFQGERDPFGKKQELTDKHWPSVDIHYLTDADHDFVPLKKSGLTQSQLIRQAAMMTKEKIDDILES